MANPFLVLGGIAVGIVTAAFGVLQVPGWVSSAQDASAKNDVAQVSILQSASLSQTGKVVDQAGLTDATVIEELGVDVTTKGEAKVLVSGEKNYAVVVASDSGNAFLRIDGGKIVQLEKGVDAPANYADAVTLAASAKDGVVAPPA